jgi:hypothetical protein
VVQERRGHQPVEEGCAQDDRRALEPRCLVEGAQARGAVVARLEALAPEEEGEETHAVRRHQSRVRSEHCQRSAHRRGSAEHRQTDPEHGETIGEGEYVGLVDVCEGSGRRRDPRCRGDRKGACECSTQQRCTHLATTAQVVGKSVVVVVVVVVVRGGFVRPSERRHVRARRERLHRCGRSHAQEEQGGAHLPR